MEHFVPLAILPVTHSDQHVVARPLKQTVTTTGVPRAILGHHGGDLQAGVRRFCEWHPETVNLYDVARKAALQLKSRLERDERWSWHGEIDAINRCVAEKPDITWSRLRLYTTAEPCCMCQGAILWAGIPEVVFGTSIRTLARLGWSQIDIPAEEVARRTPFAACSLLGDVLEAECDALFRAARQS